MNFWLVKTEPDTFSIDHLQAAGSTCWDGVRNYQARNNLMKMHLHDLVLIYHSSIPHPEVVGMAEVIREHYPDPTDYGGKFCAVNLKFIHKFSQTYTLTQMKNNPKLMDLPLLHQSRLSVISVSKDEWEEILRNTR